MTDFNRRDVVKGVGATAVASLLASRPAHAAIPEDVLKGAEKEGAVLWYDGYGREDGEAVMREFQKAFPFIKNATYIELPSAQKHARLTQECLAGGPTTDIYLQTAATFQQVVNRGFFHEVDWKELGVPDVAIASKHMAWIVTAVACALINTQKVKEADVPQSWDDFLDPKWKGRIGLWQRPTNITALAPEYGEERTREYCRKFAANDPRLFPGTIQMSQAVGAGEIDAGFGAYDTTQRMVLKGAPVRMLLLDPVPITPLYAGVCKFGKNPNAGKLLVSWLQTKEGALAFENATQRGHVLVPETKTAQLVKGKKQAFYTAAYEIEKSDHLAAFEAEMARILQGRG